MLNNLIRALRLPFIAASILPFIFGSLIKRQPFNPAAFWAGLLAVAATHLSANLLNDYADSKSGVDWQDKRFFGFFGGSKLIQEKVLPESFYFKAAALFGALALASVCVLAALLKSPAPVGFFLVIIFLGWSYSARPLRLSYRRLGEAVIFILFGLAPVMGGYYIQTGVFPDKVSFILALPFGFFTTAILFANEVPDHEDDKKAGKLNWVGLTGPDKAYLLYALLMSLGFFFISLGMELGHLNRICILTLASIAPAIRAMAILKMNYGDKVKLVESSRLTIAAQALAGVVLIFGVLL
jgi:1,4-dihydroxy-2-naphthoate polyprenyltransferase